MRGDDETGGDGNENTETKVQIDKASTATPCWGEAARSWLT